jgi:hypothetical protein
MATATLPIAIKRRDAVNGAAVPADTALIPGELAFSEADDVLYYGEGVDTGHADNVIAIGGSGAFTTLSTTQTISGMKTFSSQVTFTGASSVVLDGVDLNANTRKVVNLATPTNATDAATKAYVDSVASGLDVKASVKAMTLTNVVLNGAPTTVDGITLVNGDRYLLAGQTTTNQNGIYVVTDAGGQTPLVRATDADATGDITGGTFVFVEEGTYADTGWVVQSNGTPTLGTDPIVWVQFSGAGSFTAGSGLTQSGTTLNVGAGTGITVNADDVALATSNVLSLFNLATDGIVTRTAANTVVARTITATDGVAVTNGNGVSGAPAFALTGNALALHNLAAPTADNVRLPSLISSGWTSAVIAEPSSGTKAVGISTTGLWEEITAISGGTY